MTTEEPAALELIGVQQIFNKGRVDEVHALRGINVTLRRGEFVTVVGSNGAGKSTMVQAVAGSVRPTAGRVRMHGRDVTTWSDYKRAGLVARVFDDPRIGSAPELSIEDNLALAMSRGSRRTLRFAVSNRRRATMRDHLAQLGLGLEDRLHDRVGMLSAGQRQSLTMIMAGMQQPHVLLLDEHLAALDPATAAKVLDLTSRIVREMGCATLMVTHNMEHAIAMGDRLLVMSSGKVVADIAGPQGMSPQDVIDVIVGAGGLVNDRSLLPEDLRKEEG